MDVAQVRFSSFVLILIVTLSREPYKRFFFFLGNHSYVVKITNILFVYENISYRNLHNRYIDTM